MNSIKKEIGYFITVQFLKDYLCSQIIDSNASQTMLHFNNTEYGSFTLHDFVSGDIGMGIILQFNCTSVLVSNTRNLFYKTNT